MRLGYLIKCVGLCTIVALGYTHLQMQIISLAYRQEGQSRKIHTLLEENGDIIYRILMLKSPKHLGHAMLSQESDMQFLDPDNIIEIRSDKNLFSRDEIQTSMASTKGIKSIFSFFPLSSRAEAKSKP